MIIFLALYIYFVLSFADTRDDVAFILFRQHYQARVVAENPGLANPQISKIIGEHWKAAPDDIKQHWKALAEVSESPPRTSVQR